MLDMLKLVVDIMLLMQDLECPFWKLQKLWPVFEQKLKHAGFRCSFLKLSFTLLRGLSLLNNFR